MSVWWLVFTGVDLYIGLIALDVLGRSGSAPPEKQSRLAVVKPTISNMGPSPFAYHTLGRARRGSHLRRPGPASQMHTALGEYPVWGGLRHHSTESKEARK